MQTKMEDIIEFLKHSNFIEREYGSEAFDDALKAWKWAIKQPINLKTILGIHDRLMKRLRPDIAGEFRDCEVWIGGRRCLFINTSLLKQEVLSWIKMANSFRLEKDELFIKQDHIDFEKIHPFQDGNGRVGRILYNIQRLRAGLPLHIIHAGEEQLAYYKWFK